MPIREFQRETDLEALRACVAALQDFERALDPRLPAGQTMADAYLEQLFQRCEEFAGKIFVAETRDRITGAVTVLAEYRLDGPEDSTAPFGYIDDLFVMADRRGQGVGQALLAKAESYAKKCGRKSIRLRVKSGNHYARAFYVYAGFTEYELEFEKPL
jgi:GNAT superfamily N-acetyltransferase